MSDEDNRGVLHHQIKFNDRVYLVDQIDELLALKQDKLKFGDGFDVDEETGEVSIGDLPGYQKKLTAGRGVTITEDNVITSTFSVLPNRVGVHNINSQSYSETGRVVVSDNYHVYVARLSTEATLPFKFLRFENLVSGSSDMYCIEFWVKVMDPSLEVTFDGDNIVLVGDTNYHVDEAGKTLYFTVRYFDGKILINKYYEG